MAVATAAAIHTAATAAAAIHTAARGADRQGIAERQRGSCGHHHSVDKVECMCFFEHFDGRDGRARVYVISAKRKGRVGGHGGNGKWAAGMECRSRRKGLYRLSNYCEVRVLNLSCDLRAFMCAGKKKEKPASTNARCGVNT
ncbi:MAG: hypothetical protein J3K34DRAFT_428212 [Monoraphidium minutum]|nr:MAG: hypothetical protein J3K34DRAFT_428212 [Monoraphidium minutum]